MSHAKYYHNNKNFSIFTDTERYWFIARLPGNVCIYAHDSEHWPARVENIQATSLAKWDFSAESLRLFFDFQCSCWHFYDSGFGLLTEHSETNFLFSPSFSSLHYTRDIYYFLTKNAHPSFTRGALKQDEMAPAFVTVSRVTGDRQEPECNH